MNDCGKEEETITGERWEEKDKACKKGKEAVGWRKGEKEKDVDNRKGGKRFQGWMISALVCVVGGEVAVRKIKEKLRGPKKNECLEKR